MSTGWSYLLTRWVVVTGFAVGLSLVFSHPAVAAKRVALVIGNSAYRNVSQLTNPANDSTAIWTTFRNAGFDVVELKRDLSVSEMRRALRDFSDAARDADVAIVYFAGHGIEIEGINYVIPVDAVLERDIDAFDEAIPLDRIMTVIEPAKQLRLVILDACRDNPFNRSMKRSIGTRGIGRGLAKVEPENPNTLIAFAAKAGSVAYDGDSKNSPFTGALIKYLTRPGLDVRKAFGFARDEVLKSTGNKQEPYVYGSLGGEDVVLVPAPESATGEPGKPLDERVLELAFWESIKNERNPQLFQAYLNRYPNGAFSGIARTILKEQQVAAVQSAAVEQPNDALKLADSASLREIRERLYELNFDPGPFDGPLGGRARVAIREFEQANRLAMTGEPTQGLLRRLRDLSPLKPWGSIVYSKASNKWGMSWSQDTRKAAVASALASCGDASECPIEISFFGTECGAFAYSESGWAMAARADMQKARDDAMADCRKRGKACRIIAAICADGAQRLQAAN
ncbi:MAG: caspase family protein [Bradyrhizobium sp.]|uniref:caspase family protein n=1 Tax=Bradyrhizobium sp. TaxID=376 RepID=UPI0025BB956A|nr:caspase family protein [Bradyrhizobium sp.]MBI5264277.1 caspase family protein [Bradyrhizobium sp.]